jgi:ABC-2 type transport system permease protein
MKMCKSKIIFVSVVVCLVCIWGFGYFLKQDNIGIEELSVEEQQLQDEYENSTDWKKQLEIQMELNTYMADIYGEDQIEVNNEILQYRIDHNIKPYGDSTTWDFLAYAFEGIGFIISVFAVIFSVEIVTKEFTLKTTKITFTKPYSRQKIIWSKYVTSVLYIIALALFCYLVAFFIGGIYFSFQGAGATAVIKSFSSIYCIPSFAESLIYFGAVLINAIVVMSIAFFISLICKSQTFPLIASLGVLLFGNTIAQKIYESGFKGMRFSILSNLSLSKFIDAPIPENYTLFSFLLVVMVHIVLLVVASFEIIKRADL